MQKSHILLLDSRDRINPLVTESNNCTLRIDPAVGGFNKVELLSFNVPNIQFNVDSTNNLIYFDDGAPLTATLTPGAYNYISLPVEVKAQLEAVSANTFTVTYDENTFKLNIGISAGIFSLTFGTNTTNSAALILGFRAVDTVAASSQTSYNSINLSLPPYFYVHSPELGIHVRSTKSGDFGTFIINTSGNSGDITQFNMFSNYQLLEAFQHSSLSTVNVTLKNRGGTLLDVRGTEWSMILKLHYPDSQFI
jgi:hypothetical protein